MIVTATEFKKHFEEYLEMATDQDIGTVTKMGEFENFFNEGTLKSEWPWSLIE